MSASQIFFFDGILATCSTLLPPFVPQSFSSASLQQGISKEYVHTAATHTTTHKQGTASKQQTEALLGNIITIFKPHHIVMNFLHKFTYTTINYFKYSKNVINLLILVQFHT